jgi:quercetin dioxygenase-like cupin family protein
MQFFVSAGGRTVLAISFVFLLAGTMASADVMDEPRAKVLSYDDDGLEWNSCPDFFPEGCEMTVVQGDPEQENSDVIMRIPGKSDIPRHRHTSAERMILIAGEFHVMSEGQDTKVMEKGSYGYAPAGVPHKARCASDEDCILFIAFEEPVDAIPVD